MESSELFPIFAKKYMMDYNLIRKSLVSSPEKIVEIEKFYFKFFLNNIKDKYLDIKKDFNDASLLEDFWKKYAPRQRGRGPRNEAYPWGEVGEKVLDAYIYKIVTEKIPSVRFTGLPYGHDTRFTTENAFVQLDIKSTGPNDNLDELVSSPNQVSGDGKYLDDEGVFNSEVLVRGPLRTLNFQPELPPFYVIDGVPKLTLTYYLKCVYEVIEKGNQPLSYLELICVPNGLLMFDTFNYNMKKTGLLIPGKDIQTSEHKRTRIRLYPLSEIAPWRCVKLYEKDGEIICQQRIVRTGTDLFL